MASRSAQRQLLEPWIRHLEELHGAPTELDVGALRRQRLAVLTALGDDATSDAIDTDYMFADQTADAAHWVVDGTLDSTPGPATTMASRVGPTLWVVVGTVAFATSGVSVACLAAGLAVGLGFALWM